MKNQEKQERKHWNQFYNTALLILTGRSWSVDSIPKGALQLVVKTFVERIFEFFENSLTDVWEQLIDLRFSNSDNRRLVAGYLTSLINIYDFFGGLPHDQQKQWISWGIHNITEDDPCKDRYFQNIVDILSREIEAVVRIDRERFRSLSDEPGTEPRADMLDVDSCHAAKGLHRFDKVLESIKEQDRDNRLEITLGGPIKENPNISFYVKETGSSKPPLVMIPRTITDEGQHFLISGA